MEQRGKKSSANLATVTALPMRMLEVPADFTDEQASVWRGVIATKPSDWFDAGSIPLLAAYCRASVESARIGAMVTAMDTEWLKDDGALCRYKELRKMQAAASAELTSLGTKLRLTQQSKIRADAAGAKSRQGGGARPWSQVLEP